MGYEAVFYFDVLGFRHLASTTNSAPPEAVREITPPLTGAAHDYDPLMNLIGEARSPSIS